MQPSNPSEPISASPLAWVCAALTGFVVPALAVLVLASASDPMPLALAGGPIIAIGLMGAGIVGAAASGRFGLGILLGLLAGAGLLGFAFALGMEPQFRLASLVLAILIASLSFAARGALFAISGASRGWWIAIAVVLGEAAIVITAILDPSALPDWLLALLPAQWATTALSSALSGNGMFAAYAALIALGGTAGATLFVAALWPRRWTYIVMFSVWLSLSALVYYHPAHAPDGQTGDRAGPTSYSAGSQARG